MRSKFVSELGRFALRRSNILSEEAKLWQEVSEWISKIDLSEASVVQSNEHPKVPERISAEALQPLEAAQFLGLSKQTLAKLRMSGGGPEYVKIGRRVVYQRRALVAFQMERTRPHTSSYLLYAGKNGCKVK